MSNLMIWSTVPSGLRWASQTSDADPMLRLSLVLSPKLRSESAEPRTLEANEFHDFTDWPALLKTASFALRIRKGETAVENESDIFKTKISTKQTFGRDPSSALWKTIFPPDTVVTDFGASSNGAAGIRSYDANQVEALVSYAYLAELHAVRASLSASRSDLSSNPVLRALYDQGATSELQSMFGIDNARVDTTFKALRDFHEARTESQPFDINEVNSSRLDFHSTLSALQEHNALCRWLGLTLDFEVAVPIDMLNQIEGVGRVKVDVTLASTFNPTTFNPWTAVDVVPKVGSSSIGIFHPRRQADQVADETNGFKSLAATSGRLLAVDLDWGGLNVIATAQQLKQASLPLIDEYTSPLPAPTTLVALRQGGISFADLPSNNEALDAVLPLLVDIQQADARNQQLDAAQQAQLTTPSPDVSETLFSSHLNRGYRVFVKASGSNDWYSLCRRDVTYTFLGGPLKQESWSALDDQGEVTKVTFAGGAVSPYLWNWSGWSLVVPRIEDPTDDDGVPSPLASPAINNVTIAAKVVDGSLARKRLGVTYDFIIVTVDQAGTSWSLAEAAEIVNARKEAGEHLDYLPTLTASIDNARLEPVRPPFVVYAKTEEFNDKGNLIVLRSFDNSVPTPISAHIFPSDASQSFCEEHGVFDGLSDEDSFEVLLKTSGSTPNANALNELMNDDGTLRVPYLPDPMCRGAILSLVEGNHDVGPVAFPPQSEIVKSESLLNSIKLTVSSSPTSETRLSSTFAGFSLSIPPGVSRTLEIKSSVDSDRMKQFWLANQAARLLDSPVDASNAAKKPLIIEASKLILQSIQSSSEPLITPAAELTVVHATQRPLQLPTFGAHFKSEKTGLNEVSATLFDPSFECHVPSTGRIEFVATWKDQIDVPWDESFSTIDGAVPPFGYNLAPADSMGLGVPGMPESYWASAASDKEASPLKESRLKQTELRPGPTHHNFPDTRYRRVKYTARAVSRYGNFMPKEIADDPDALSVFNSLYVDVLNSAAPHPPIVRAVLPVFRTETIEEPQGRTVRHISGVRFLIERPWLSSGEGEQFAIVLHKGTMDSANPVLIDRITQWGFNPRKLGAATAIRPTLDDIANADANVHDIKLRADSSSMEGEVAMAAFNVEIDAHRNVVYCDVEIDPGRAFSPWIRFAVARYQPNSIAGAELSEVVLADFVQLGTRRNVSFSKASSKSRNITVSGFSYFDEGPQLTSTFEAFAEKRISTVDGTGALWQMVGEAIELVARQAGAELMTWSGELNEPEGQWRVTIVEYEYFPIEPDTEVRAEGERFKIGNQQYTRRVIFIDSIELK